MCSSIFKICGMLHNSCLVPTKIRNGFMLTQLIFSSTFTNNRSAMQAINQNCLSIESTYLSMHQHKTTQTHSSVKDSQRLRAFLHMCNRHVCMQVFNFSPVKRSIHTPTIITGLEILNAHYAVLRRCEPSQVGGNVEQFFF